MSSNYIMVSQAVGQFLFYRYFFIWNRENDMQENGLLYPATQSSMKKNKCIQLLVAQVRPFYYGCHMIKREEVVL